MNNEIVPGGRKVSLHISVFTSCAVILLLNAGALLGIPSFDPGPVLPPELLLLAKTSRAALKPPKAVGFEQQN